MNKAEKEVIQYQLNSEKAVLDELRKQYQRALNDIDLKIRILQSDELTQSKIYQLQYQKVLKKQVEAILEKLHADEYTTIQQFLTESYTTGFVGTMYDMHSQGVPLILPIDQNAAVKAVMTDSKIKEGLYETLGVDVNRLKKSISGEITRGIASGLSYYDIARNISTATKAPYSRAKTIVRTEAHRIQQASTMDAQKLAKSKGADVVKQWDATLDGDTRPTHRELDGQIQEVDKPFEANGKKAMFPGDFGDPAEDCNCRCVSLTRAKWALGEDELKTLQERAEFFGLDKTDAFEDFRNKYLEMSKMATELETSNDWSKTVARSIPKEKKKELIQYAESLGIMIPDLKQFDGDPDLLIAEVDTLARMRSDFPVGKKLIVTVSHSIPDDEFASIIDSHITLNANALRNREITERNILLGGQFASTTVEDIVAHEYGHLINTAKGNKGLDFARNAYYNVFRESVSDSELIMFIHDHVSEYAIQTSSGKNKFKEIVPEILAKNNSNASEFTTAFVDLLKGWLTQ